MRAKALGDILNGDEYHGCFPFALSCVGFVQPF